jgi:hypothetical protein
MVIFLLVLIVVELMAAVLVMNGCLTCLATLRALAEEQTQWDGRERRKGTPKFGAHAGSRAGQ